MDIIDIIKFNYKWIFSGIGVLIITTIFSLIRRSNSNNQKIGNKSNNNIQINGNVNINNNEDSKDKNK